MSDEQPANSDHASDEGGTGEAGIKPTSYDWNDFVEDISKAIGRNYDPETPVYEYVEAISDLQQQLAASREEVARLREVNGALKAALTKLYTAARAIEDFVPMNEEVRPNIYFRLSEAIGDAASVLVTAASSASAASADDDFAQGFADGVTEALTNKKAGDDSAS